MKTISALMKVLCGGNVKFHHAVERLRQEKPLSILVDALLSKLEQEVMFCISRQLVDVLLQTVIGVCWVVLIESFILYEMFV